MTDCAIYVFRNPDNQVLYIGQTSSPGNRLIQHFAEKPWVTDIANIEWITQLTREEALHKERELIQSLAPLYNKILYSPSPSPSKGTYRWEWVPCGHKERCKRCKSGQKHGPYLYWYFYHHGKYQSQYVKLSELAKHPNAPPRPV